MADDWVNPDSAPQAFGWTDEDNARDGDTGTYAYTSFPDSPIELTLNSAINCDKIRLFAHDEYYAGDTDPDVTIDLWYDGDEDYTAFFTGTITKDTWVEKAIGETKSVLKVQVEAETLASVHKFYLYAVQFNQVAAATSIKTICGVAIAAIKTVSGVAIADVKSVLGVSNVD